MSFNPGSIIYGGLTFINNGEPYIIRNTAIYQKPYKSHPEVFLDNDFNCGFVEPMHMNRNMKYHSDCTLDMEEGSSIGLRTLRGHGKLIFRSKEDPTDVQEWNISSDKIFRLSYELNDKYQHTLVGSGVMLTLYKSKTKDEGQFHFPSYEEQNNFFKLRKTQNETVGFKWGEIDYSFHAV
jgi:hypothetical protein